MNHVKDQEKLLNVMESWRDVGMAPDNPNQPSTYQEARQQYNTLQDLLRKQSTQTPAAEGNDRGFWDAVTSTLPEYFVSGREEAALGATRGKPINIGFPSGVSSDDMLHKLNPRQFKAMQVARAAQTPTAKEEYKAQVPEFLASQERMAAGRNPLAAGIQDATKIAAYNVTQEPGYDLLSPAQQKWQQTKAAIAASPGAMYDVGFTPSVNFLGQVLGASPTAPIAAALGAMRGRKPAAIGAGLGAYIDERKGGILRALETEGINPRDPGILQYLDDHPEAWALAETQADKRAAVIGIMSAISGGVASKIGQLAGKGSIPRALAFTAADAPISAVLEGVGEGGAQILSGQEYDPSEVAIEVAAGGAMNLPTTAVSAVSSAASSRPMELNDTTRALVEKEVYDVASRLPYGGMVNVVQGERVYDGQGELPGSAEYIGTVGEQGPNVNVHVDNLFMRSDGTRSGIRKQVVEDLYHEIGGHDWVQQQLVNNKDFVQEAFSKNKDLILAWQKKSAYGHLETKDHDILYEEWVAQFNEMDAKFLRRMELTIVNYLQKWLGKAATAKLIKSWDDRNITMRNIAQEYLGQLRERGKAGETQPVQTVSAEEAADMPRPFEEDFVPRESRGEIQDPSRRRFMKQAAGAVAGAAVDPSILLEPATPTPPVTPPGFGGFGAGPGIAPEYEAMVKAGEMASPSGLVSDVASRAFDDFDADVALEEDKARQEQLDEYEAKEAADAEAEGDAELYVKIVDEILSIYDADATAVEAARDGTLNDRIISYAAETPFTREELWEGVDQRIEELAEDTAEPTTRRREARERKPKSETVQRDINEEKGKANKRILADAIEDADKEARTKLLKRLQNVMGSPARKRGIDAGDQDVFKEQAAKIEAGDIDAVETFITPFEEELTGSSETVRMADRRRALRAERIGKTDAEILKYRPKGAKHPMEGKMTYPFAMEEINKQEEAGEITAEEAEIRRLAVNNVRRIFKGKAGPTVKRTITEAVYGIGAYEDLVPWSEVYTEEQTEEMGERAEIGQAEARRTRYDPTDLTGKQRTDLLEAAETAEEKSILDEAEGNPPYPDVDKFDSNQDPIFNAFQKTMLGLETRADRLAFLRAPAEFKSETEEKEMTEFRKTLKTKEPYDERKVQEKETKKKEDLISKAMAEGNFTQLPPAEITKITDYQRSVVNIEPAGWDRLRTRDEVDRDTAFEIYGDAYTEQGELINESEMELVDPNGVMPRRRESKVKTNEDKLTALTGRIAVTEGDYHKRLQVQLADTKLILKELEDLEGKTLTRRSYASLNNRLKAFDKKYEHSEIKLSTLFDNIKQVDKTFDSLRRALVNQISKDLLKGTEFEQTVNEITEFTKDLNETLGKGTHEMEHILNISAKQVIDGSLSGLYEEARALTIPGNLIPMLRDVHKIKSRFEKRSQGAAPYKSIADLVSDSRFDNQNEDFKVHGIKLSEARAVKAYREVLKKGMAEQEYDAQTLQDLYQAAAEAFYSNGGTVENRINTEPTKATPGVTEGMRIVRDTLYKEGGYELPETSEHPLVEEALIATNIVNGEKGRARFSKAKEKDVKYTEHFNDGFWYTITSFLWGKPVQSIRDINKSSRFGSKQGNITAADKIADLIQRSQSSTKRTEGMEMGTDMMQDVSMRSGEFYTKLSRIFALATGRAGDIDAKANKQMIDHLMGREVNFANKDIKAAAEELKALIESVYAYGKDSTSNLETPLNLRGEGDTIVPRVWNIEYIATRKGKAEFLKTVNNVLRGKDDINVTPEEMYEAVINSGGFVQGDWTNMKADQTRTLKDIERDQLIGETLDAMPTGNMMDSGLVIEDLQALVPRFIQKAIERTEYSRRFGTSDELLRGMITEGLEQIRENNREVLKLGENKEGLMHIDEKKFTKAVWDMSRILRNQYGYDMANMATRKWLQRAANTETILKLPFVTLASIPEFFTPMLKGDVRPDKWFVDFMAGTAWAGYKGMNGLSKLLFNKHLPAMRKASKDIGGMGIISDVQLLRELGIADIQAMGDLVSTRYANPNFARGGLRGGAKGTIAGKVPKKVRAVFNMQTYMQGTLLTTITEMQQLMALRNFQRHMGRRVQFVSKNAGKDLTGRKARLMKQFTQDLADYGVTGDIDLDTSTGQAEFNAGALRFIDQVITRPNDATTAKIFKNPLTAPLVLFKRFITVFGNTLMTSIGNDFATKTSNVERAKQVAQVASVAMIMYGSVMFAEIIRGVLKGDLDEEDFKLMPDDFAQFMRRLDRTGLSSAPGAVAINLAFPYKRGWWDTTQSRVMNELLGPLGGDLTAFGDALISGKNNSWQRLLGQAVPSAKPLLSKKQRDLKRKRSMSGQGLLY